MTRTLVTILGKAQRRDGDAGYTEATYRFPNGDQDRSAFFGLALARYLKPDEIVILGTAGSMWSVLVENLADDSRDEDARIKLMDAENVEAVDQPLLDDVAPLMERAIGAVVRPTLIPYGKDEREQHGILKAVDGAVAKNSDLHFDLTHGFRHVGMVGFLSSFMLERLRRLTVCGLWYGALDMKEDGIATVLELDGLTQVRRWLDALDRFDATGDYGAFVPLLKKDGVPNDKASCLEDAAFLERTINVRDAAKKIAAFLPVLDVPLTGASGLFQDRLVSRLRWANADRLSEQQRQLAGQYLARDDFVRAAIFGREACVSRECERHGISTSEFSDGRKQAVAKLENELGGERSPRALGYWTLRDIRNALAHGTRPSSRTVEDALKDPKRLGRELRRALERFFSADDVRDTPPAHHRELQKALESIRSERRDLDDQTT